MDACACDRCQGFHGACQFAFQRALVVDLFQELAGAELLVFHQFEADRTALGQAFRGHLQAHFMHFVGGHHQRADFGEFVGNVLLLQGLNDCSAVAFGHIRIQHAVIGRLSPHEQPCQQRNRGGDGYDQAQLLLIGHAEQQPGQRRIRGICISHAFLPNRTRGTPSRCALSARKTRSVCRKAGETGRFSAVGPAHRRVKVPS